MDFVDFVNFDF